MSTKLSRLDHTLGTIPTSIPSSPTERFCGSTLIYPPRFHGTYLSLTAPPPPFSHCQCRTYCLPERVSYPTSTGLSSTLALCLCPLPLPSISSSHPHIPTNLDHHAQNVTTTFCVSTTLSFAFHLLIRIGFVIYAHSPSFLASCSDLALLGPSHRPSSLDTLGTLPPSSFVTPRSSTLEACARNDPIPIDAGRQPVHSYYPLRFFPPPNYHRYIQCSAMFEPRMHGIVDSPITARR